MNDAFRQDIQQLYLLADASATLADFIPSLTVVLSRNEESLNGFSYAYRIVATDTEYRYAFALTQGQFSELTPASPVDVTVSGKDIHLLSIFQRKVSPMKALLLGRVRVEGNQSALLQLAKFL